MPQVAKKESNVFTSIAAKHDEFSGIEHSLICASPETYRNIGRMRTVKQVREHYRELSFTGDIPRDTPYGVAITALQGTTLTTQKAKEEAMCFYWEDLGKLYRHS